MPSTLCLSGQSLGGAIVLDSTLPGGPLHNKVKGIILLCPMCRMADNMMMPVWLVRHLALDSLPVALHGSSRLTEPPLPFDK